MDTGKIPQKVIKILSDRTKAAQMFMSLDSELTQWMEKQGIDISSKELTDHIHGGCASIINPKESENAVLRFLACWECNKNSK